MFGYENRVLDLILEGYRLIVLCIFTAKIAKRVQSNKALICLSMSYCASLRVVRRALISYNGRIQDFSAIPSMAIILQIVVRLHGLNVAIFPFASSTVTNGVRVLPPKWRLT